MYRVSKTTDERQLAQGALSVLENLPPHRNIADKEFIERQIKFHRKQYRSDPRWGNLGRIYALKVIHTENFKGMEIQVEDEV